MQLSHLNGGVKGANWVPQHLHHTHFYACIHNSHEPSMLQALDIIVGSYQVKCKYIFKALPFS